MDVPNMRGGGEQGRGNRQARLLPPSGDPEVYKVVSLVLGTPEFQRQVGLGECRVFHTLDCVSGTRSTHSAFGFMCS
jgi:hypothetical protein